MKAIDKFPETMQSPAFFRSSRSHSRGSKRSGSARSRREESSTVLQSTYNFDYKNPDRPSSDSLTRKSNQNPVRMTDHEFHVCPKYLHVTSDFEDVASISTYKKPTNHTNGSGNKSSKRGSSSKKNSTRYVRSYIDEKYDFIESYNDIVLKNKVLTSEVRNLKRVVASSYSPEEMTQQHTYDLCQGEDYKVVQEPQGRLKQSKYITIDENSNILSIQPETIPVLDINRELSHLSPINSLKDREVEREHPQNERMVYTNNHDMVNTTNASSLQFNVSNSGSKQVRYKDRLDHDYTDRKVSDYDGLVIEKAVQECAKYKGMVEVCQEKILELEKKNGWLSEEVERKAAELQVVKKGRSESEAMWTGELGNAKKENVRLTEEMSLLRLEINNLKYDCGSKEKNERDAHGELLKKYAEVEGELSKSKAACRTKDEEILKLQASLKDLQSTIELLRVESPLIRQKSGKESSPTPRKLSGILKTPEKNQSRFFILNQMLLLNSLTS